MHEDNRTALLNDYPNLYRQAIHFDVEDGWVPLINDLSRVIEDILMKMPEDERNMCYAVQVKEKFGTLRFYMSSETDAICAAIDVAQANSMKICESCGNPGVIRGKGNMRWIQTLCEDCFK